MESRITHATHVHAAHFACMIGCEGWSAAWRTGRNELWTTYSACVQRPQDDYWRSREAPEMPWARTAHAADLLVCQRASRTARYASWIGAHFRSSCQQRILATNCTVSHAVNQALVDECEIEVARTEAFVEQREYVRQVRSLETHLSNVIAEALCLPPRR